MNNEKTISIIIPTYNKLERLRLVLKSLENQVNDDVEVIVVFDGCNEEVIVEFKKIKFKYDPMIIIYKQNRGRAYARNRGLDVATGRIIAFVDDDRVVAPDFVCRHMNAHKRIGRPAVVLGGRKETYFTDRELSIFGEQYDGLLEQCANKGIHISYPYERSKLNIFRWLNFSTCNVSVEKDLILQAGNFDEHLVKWGAEDTDLGIKLALSKVEFFYERDALNYHLSHASNYENAPESLYENIKYLAKKYKSHLSVQWGLLLLYTNYKIHKRFVIHSLLVEYEADKSKEKLEELH